MAFDQKTRNLLQRTVTACRRALDREFTTQLQELYGIQPDGSLTPIAALDHLGDEQLDVARLLRERINHLEGGTDAEALTRTAAKPEHIARVIREQAFTVLNRLAALRLCEERLLVLECVRQGVNSEGFQLFMSSAGNALGETHAAYHVYLHCLFDELGIDLGVLFDRFSPLALLFPRHDALTEVLSELNGTGKAAEREELPPEQFAKIWQADETIGWIYQYYNDETERKKMREESAAPRNSRELAVRNQFFTPRYVVEFLTDNTLGRIWYEMCAGATSLKERCRYLVRRPNEIFLKLGETAPEQTKQDNLSQGELLKQPVFIPHRPLKDPRTILMLDPACGSMHFGLYAFDLFEVIYCESWELEEKLGADTLIRPPGMKSLRETFATKEEFLGQVSRLIIEHNIHGIDIDPRAAQIAGLALWLRAQNAWKAMDLKPAERPRITRSNIVCAEPMPGEKELLREFVEKEFPPAERGVFLQLLETIFDKMQLAGEAGSLLKIEEEIRSAIADAKQLWKETPKAKQSNLFTETGQLEQKEIKLDVSGITDEQFWGRVEERIYAALRDFAEQAESGGGFQRRLFAEDAARGFAFIDVCRKRYDVALMNPPFGLPTDVVFAFMQRQYPNTYVDIYGAFAERGATLCREGLVGAITPRTFIAGSKMARWRKSELVGTLELLADFGIGVMDDAMVRSCAYLLRPIGSPFSNILAWDVRVDDKAREMENIFCDSGMQSVKQLSRAFVEKLPDNKILYFVTPHLAQLLLDSEPLEPNTATVRGGLRTFDDQRYLRLRWEAEAEHLGRGKDFDFYAKGGEYANYYTNIHLLVCRRRDARELCETNRLVNGQTAQVRQGESYYYLRGCQYTTRSKGFSARAIPDGCVMSSNAPVILTTSNVSTDYLLGWVNSRFIRSIIEMQSMADDFIPGTLKSLPWIHPDTYALKTTETHSSHLAAIYRALAASDEVDPFFLSPTAGCFGDSISAIHNAFKSKADTAYAEIRERQKAISESIDGVYGFDSLSLGAEVLERDVTEELTHSVEPVVDLTASMMAYALGVAYGRWDIRYATGEQSAPELPDPFAPLPVCPPGQLQNVQGLPARPEDVPATYPITIQWDGIIADDPTHPVDIERCVREVIEEIWKDCANTIEQEACEILGVDSLRDYFRRPAGFFADHLKRYSKSRRQAPIYWPLATASGSYTLWIYYHRLDDQTLYKCIQQFIDPKLADVEKELTHLRAVLAANEGGAKERKRLEELETLRRELIELRTELELWAPKWKPNLNDGVLITAAALWKLFRLPKWQKDLKACWQELEKGEYDWAHLAYTLWPDRVREKCKSDRSLAIAHNLEDLCDVKAPEKKVKKAKAKPASVEAELIEE